MVKPPKSNALSSQDFNAWALMCKIRRSRQCIAGISSDMSPSESGETGAAVAEAERQERFGGDALATRPNDIPEL
jgi:hypothetical protein